MSSPSSILQFLLGSALMPGGGSKTPRAGDMAPEFRLVGSDGKTYRLADYRNRRAVVIAWFPKAFTGG